MKRQQHIIICEMAGPSDGAPSRPCHVEFSTIRLFFTFRVPCVSTTTFHTARLAVLVSREDEAITIHRRAL